MKIKTRRTNKFHKNLESIRKANNLTDDELNYLLWEETSFPFGDAKMIMKQLENAIKKTTG